MRAPISGIAGAIIIAAFLISRDCTADQASAFALLRGAELARTDSDSIRATIDLRFSLSSGTRSARCEIELSGGRLRSELFPDDGEWPPGVVLRNGTEFTGYRRLKNDDVELYDLRRSAAARVDIAFDPRTLGLSDLPSPSLTTRGCLWYDNCEELGVVGREELRGIEAWHVKAKRKGTTVQYWIEEPSFRVHRCTMEWPGTIVEINSEFDQSVIPSPFPSRVVAVRTTAKSREERVYAVKRLERDAKIPPERFTLNSIGLPVNTMINDYRVSRIVGYWDGDKIVPHPVAAVSNHGHTTGGSRLGLWTLLALAVVVVGIVAALARSITSKRADGGP